MFGPDLCMNLNHHPFDCRRVSGGTGGSARLLLLLLAWGLSFLFTGCRPRPAHVAWTPLEIGALSGTNALQEARNLVALGLRDSGTPGAQRAAAHILERLQQIGLAAEIDAFNDETHDGPISFWNVTAALPAAVAQPEEAPWIFLGSHFDTKSGIGGGFEGANDSASSTGLLLELARVLHAGGPQPFNIGLLFFDGEECRRQYGANDGLHGSRRAARALKMNRRANQVRAVLVLDMIGDKDLTVTVPRNCTPELSAMVFAAAKAEGARDKFALAPGAILDDHQPFLELGMPAALLIDFEYGSAPGRNDYWHTPHDTMDKLSAASLELVGRVVLRMLNAFSLNDFQNSKAH